MVMVYRPGTSPKEITKTTKICQDNNRSPNGTRTANVLNVCQTRHQYATKLGAGVFTGDCFVSTAVIVHRTERTKFKNFFFNYIKCKNTFTSNEDRFLSNARTQYRPPDSRLPPNVDFARPHHRHHHSLVCISCHHSRHRHYVISFSSASHNWRTRVTDIGYYIICR
jgi:hypothetical protein